MAVRKAEARPCGRLKRQLDDARNALAAAQRNGEFQKAGELAYGTIPQLEKELAEAEQHDGSTSMVEETVTPDHIAQSFRAGLAFRLTGCWKVSVKSCCVWKMSWPSGSSARAKQFRLSPRQCAAPVPGCRIRTGPSVRSSSWPTGVGKTELTKALAAFLF